MIKIIARSILIITIASGSLIACGGSGDATPTSLAEKIAQTIEKNSYTTVECAEIDMDPPGYLKGNKESGVCDDFIIVTYDPEVNTEWTDDFTDFVNAQGSFFCSLSSRSLILSAWSESKNFGIYADINLGNSTEISLLNTFRQIARDAGAEKALYVKCSDGEGQRIF